MNIDNYALLYIQCCDDLTIQYENKIIKTDVYIGPLLYALI